MGLAAHRWERWQLHAASSACVATSHPLGILGYRTVCNDGQLSYNVSLCDKAEHAGFVRFCTSDQL